jgi:beta-lactamase regulating signal transducer with metallopeptidase domain
MNQIAVLVAWCWVEALIVASLAILFSGLVMRRSPAASAAIAWTGVLVTLVVTLLAPMPIPRWALPVEPARQTTKHRTEVSSFADESLVNPSRRDATTDGLSANAKLNLEFLRGIVTSLEQSRPVVAIHSTTGRIVVGCVALGVLLSIIRLAYAVWAIRILYRGSRVIEDEQLATVVASLSLKLGVQRLPDVRESGGVVSAAVVGWRQPSVVLPCQWREWTSAELRAVLAHELAHIARHDPLLRLMAALTVALQSAQPLVYWLRRQLMLSQELAADELAAVAVGSSAEYLHALSKLALRQDSRPMDGPAGMLLPVFSGYLLRRIEMLRAKDGSTGRVRRSLLQWSAIAILIGTAASVTALRGLAQSPATKTDPSIRVARVPEPEPKPAGNAADAHAASTTLFQRPAFDLTTAAVRDSKGFIIRVGEIFRRPEMVPIAKIVDDWFVARWKEIVPNENVPAWSLKDIEYIAGDFRLVVKAMPQPTVDGSNQIMLGSHWLVVRWQQPVQGQYESLLRWPAGAGEASATKKLHGSAEFVDLPIIPVMGPSRMCVCQLDAHTLLIAKDEVTLKARLHSLAVKPNPPSWLPSWKGVEGGLVSVITTNGIEEPLGAPVDDEARMLQNLFHARQCAVGVDWQSGVNPVGVIKLQLQFDDQASAELFCTSLRTFVAVHALNDTLATSDAHAKGADTLLRSAKVSTRKSDSVWQVDVQFAGPFDSPWLGNP